MKGKMLRTKTVQTDKKKSQNGLRRVIAAVLAFFSSVLMLSELMTVALYVLPFLSVQMYQVAGVKLMTDTMVLADMTVVNFVVLMMMWFFPTLFLCAILILIHWKLIRVVMRRVGLWLKIVFPIGRKSVQDEENTHVNQ